MSGNSRNNPVIGIPPIALLVGLAALVSSCAQPLNPRPRPAIEPEGKAQTRATGVLPTTSRGYVDWALAMKQGVINPKYSIEPEPPPEPPPLKLDIVFKINEAYPVPDVVFPHEPHTVWLDCKNCHPGIFVMRQGANPVSMERILKGEFCGRCHGVVAFPLLDCFRCHSRPKKAG
jgi:c(7)-type cytochrome triheme protein